MPNNIKYCIKCRTLGHDCSEKDFSWCDTPLALKVLIEHKPNRLRCAKCGEVFEEIMPHICRPVLGVRDPHNPHLA